MNIIEEQIRVITTGSPAEVKAAQKEVERYWREAGEEPALKRDFRAFIPAARAFDAIGDTAHKSYFINTLKWAFWSDSIEDFPFWADFILDCVQRPEGRIRRAAVLAAEPLMVELTSFFADKETLYREDVPPAVAARARRYFCEFACRTDMLITRYYRPEYRRCRHIDTLPAGVYKSLQQLMYEAVLPGDYFERIYCDYLETVRRRGVPWRGPAGHA